MAYLDHLVNGLKCTTHNLPLQCIAKLARKYLAIPASSAPSEGGMFQEPSCCTSPTAGGINYAKAQCMDIRCFERNKPMLLLNAKL